LRGPALWATTNRDDAADTNAMWIFAPHFWRSGAPSADGGPPVRRGARFATPSELAQNPTRRCRSERPPARAAGGQNPPVTLRSRDAFVPGSSRFVARPWGSGGRGGQTDQLGTLLPEPFGERLVLCLGIGLSDLLVVDIGSVESGGLRGQSKPDERASATLR